MKKSTLRSLIQEILEEEFGVDEASKAAQDAKAQGLDYIGFGRWGKNGKVTHKSSGGKLVAITKSQTQKDTGMTFGRGKQSNTMYGTKGTSVYRPTAKFDKETGKLSSLTKRSPEQEKERQSNINTMGPNADKLARKDSDMKRYKEYPLEKFRIIASSLEDKLDSAVESGDLNYGDTYTSSEFMKRTGLKPVEFKYLSKYNDKYAGWDATFSYDEDNDEVYFNDPQDI